MKSAGGVWLVFRGAALASGCLGGGNPALGNTPKASRSVVAERHSFNELTAPAAAPSAATWKAWLPPPTNAAQPAPESFELTWNTEEPAPTCPPTQQATAEKRVMQGSTLDWAALDGNPTDTHQAPSAKTNGLPVSNVGRVVMDMHGDFAKCYQIELRKNSKAHGHAAILITVACDGNVSEAHVTAQGLSTALVDCVLSRAHASRFEPPADGHAVVSVPVTFVVEPPKR